MYNYQKVIDQHTAKGVSDVETLTVIAMGTEDADVLSAISALLKKEMERNDY